MEKKYYNLVVICEGAMPEFTVDEETLGSFEKSFDAEKGIIKFTDREDRGEVKLRNKKLVGYKKTHMRDVPMELREKGKIKGVE